MNPFGKLHTSPLVFQIFDPTFAETILTVSKKHCSSTERMSGASIVENLFKKVSKDADGFENVDEFWETASKNFDGFPSVA